MQDEVWGGVKDWGLKDHSDGSAVFSTDPVCGKRVDEAKAAGRTGYAGTVYYFCSKECQRTFEQAPGQHIGQPHLPLRREIDVNTATKEDLKSIFHTDEDRIDQIIQNRPYKNWTEFKSKNPGFSDVMLESLKQSGVSISVHDLHRIVWP